jgi:pheromone shutdown protein TraB
MPQITLKETITKTIDIPMDALMEIVDRLTDKEKTRLMARLKADKADKAKVQPVKIFREDSIEEIVSEFRATDLYEEGFLKDLEEGLKRSSPYRSEHADHP